MTPGCSFRPYERSLERSMKLTDPRDRFLPGGRNKWLGRAPTNRAEPVISCRFPSEKRFDGTIAVILALPTLPVADLW